MMALLARPTTPPQWTLRGAMTLGTVKAAALSLTFAVSFLGSAVVADLTDSRARHGPPAPVAVDPTVAMIAKYRCSTTGFAGEQVPASALVRRGGVLQQVSFDAGRATYQGRRPGSLVAVCRAPLAAPTH